MDYNLKTQLKKLRQERGYSQQQLADELNISRQAISKWENGKAIPDIDNLHLLCNLYGVSLDNIFSNEKFLEDREQESKKIKFDLKHFLLITSVIISYFISPFGFIILAIAIFLIKKTDGHRLLLLLLFILALLKNVHDAYYILKSNTSNHEHEIELIED